MSGQLSSVLFRKLTKTVAVASGKSGEDSKQRRVLDEVSGVVNGTEMMAVLGASGSGKTTLLQLIGGRNLLGTSGEVFLNGERFQRQHRRSIAFVEQEDIFFDSQFLTVRDQLQFSVTMRWTSGTPKRTLDAEVDKILLNLDLVAAADQPIILISGGERRRVSIGCELLCPNPCVLAIDEGTSGLDSASSSKMVRTLRKLCYEKRIPVLMSIHQPSQSVFFAFDKVMFLTGGKPVFYGSPTALMPYLHAVGLKQYGAGVNLTPPEFALQLLALSAHDDDDDDDVHCFCFKPPHSSASQNPLAEGITPKAILVEAFDNEAYQQQFYQSCVPHAESKLDPGEPVVLGSVEDIEDAFRRRHLSHDEYGLMPSTHEQGPGPLLNGGEVRGVRGRDKSDEKESPVGGRGEWKLDHPANWRTQFVALLRRARKQANSSRFSWLNVGQTLILGLLAGVAWWQIPLRESRLQDLSGFLFFSVTYVFFSGSFSGTLEFLPERPVLKRERALGLYHLSAYLVAKQVSTLPVRLGLATSLFTISYLMAIPYVTPTLFFTILSVILLTTLTGESIGMFIGTLTLNFEKAVAIATVTLLGVLLLGGFYVRELPYWLTWLKYTSPLRYSFAAVSQIQLTYAPSRIACEGFNIFDEVSCVLEEVTGQLVAPSNDLAKDFFGVDELTVTANCLILLLFRTAFRLFTYLSLRFLRLNYGRR